MKPPSDPAKVSLDNAKSELDRNTELFDKGLVSKKALEDAQAQHANAEVQHENATTRVQSQKQAITSQERTIQTRDTAVVTREAILAQEERNLQNLKNMRQEAEEEAQLRVENSRTRLQELMETFDNEKLLTQQSRVSAEANQLRRESSLKNEAERLDWTHNPGTHGRDCYAPRAGRRGNRDFWAFRLLPKSTHYDDC